MAKQESSQNKWSFLWGSEDQWNQLAAIVLYEPHSPPTHTHNQPLLIFSPSINTQGWQCERSKLSKVQSAGCWSHGLTVKNHQSLSVWDIIIMGDKKNPVKIFPVKKSDLWQLEAVFSPSVVSSCVHWKHTDWLINLCIQPWHTLYHPTSRMTNNKCKLCL